MFPYHIRGVCQLLTGLSILSNFIWFTISYQVIRSGSIILPNGDLFGIYTLSYSCIASVIGVVGLFGFSRNLSKAIYLFGNFLIFDTVLAATGRFILVTMTSQWLEETLCKPSFSVAGVAVGSSWLGDFINGVPNNNAILAAEENCGALVFMGSIALITGIIFASIIQFIFVGMVLRYASSISSSPRGGHIVGEKSTTTFTT